MKTVLILGTILFAFTYSVFSQEERKVIRQGNEYYNEDDYDNAISKYRKAYELTPDNYELLNNVGAAQYRNGMFNESAMTYDTFLKMSGSKEEKADGFYNIGNSYLQAADYEKSIEAYQNALRLDPNHDLSRYNMAVATKIQEQQQQEQQQDQEQGDGDGENDKDQQEKQDGEDEEDESQGDQDQQTEEENENEQQKPQPKENEMTREEMERFLESLQQQEKDVQEKVEREKFKTQQRVVEKEW